MSDDLSFDTTDCPYCSEVIKTNAKKCKHCGEIVDAQMRDIEALKKDKTPSSVFMGAGGGASSATGGNNWSNKIQITDVLSTSISEDNLPDIIGAAINHGAEVKNFTVISEKAFSFTAIPDGSLWGFSGVIGIHKNIVTVNGQVENSKWGWSLFHLTLALLFWLWIPVYFWKTFRSWRLAKEYARNIVNQVRLRI